MRTLMTRLVYGLLFAIPLMLVTYAFAQAGPAQTESGLVAGSQLTQNEEPAEPDGELDCQSCHPAFYQAWGDIVGGIGSYPILGNPHYHQPHDILETINHQLVAEVSKTTVASIMLLASTPARLTGLEATLTGGIVQVKWNPAPEKTVTRYVVAYGPPNNPGERSMTVSAERATLTGAQRGWRVAVKLPAGNGKPTAT